MLEPITAQNASCIPNAAFRAYAQMYIDIDEDFRESVASFGLPIAESGARGEAEGASTASGSGSGVATDVGTAPAAAGASRSSCDSAAGHAPENAYPRSSCDSAAGHVLANAYTPFSTHVDGLAKRGLAIENDRKSFVVNWLSPACLTCRKGVATKTFLSSTQCPRSCYFCFNPNQEDYEYYLHHVHDMAAELEAHHARGDHFDDLAVTGGEPLLHKAETLAFFAKAQELYPQAYTRLYTSGAYLDEAYLSDLRDAGLDEIRFSIKTDEPSRVQDDVLDKMSLAKGHIGTVMVEMPVMPDEFDLMKSLLVRLDERGIAGINLLELCYPLNNAEEFAKRGYKVKSSLYRVLYNYIYAGGLPIEGSEEACLRLLEFALDAHLHMGVHYCSLENKFTGQVYLQNNAAEGAFPCYVMSKRDHFLKAAKAFGEDAAKAKAFFDANGMREYRAEGMGSAGVGGSGGGDAGGAAGSGAEGALLEFPLSYLALMGGAFPRMPVGVSYCVAEERDGEQVLRELRIDLTTPATFDEAMDS